MRLTSGQSEHDRVDDHVVAGHQIEVEADAELDERRQAPIDHDRTVIDVVDPCEELQQSALAAAVSTNDPEELASGDLERHVLNGTQRVHVAPAERVQGPFLERVILLARKPEGLADAIQRDRRRGRYW